MNDLSNMPIVTPMNDSQWVPDGSGITPFSLGDGTIVYGHRTASGEVYDGRWGSPHLPHSFTTPNATSLPQRGGIFHYHFLFRIDL